VTGASKRRGSDAGREKQQPVTRLKPKANMHDLFQLDRTILVPALAQVFIVATLLFYVVALGTDSWQTNSNLTVGLWKVCATSSGAWGQVGLTDSQVLKFLKCYAFDDNCQADLSKLYDVLHSGNSSRSMNTTDDVFGPPAFFYPQECDSVRSTRAVIFLGLLLGAACVLLDLFATRKFFGSWQITVVLVILAIATGE